MSNEEFEVTPGCYDRQLDSNYRFSQETVTFAHLEEARAKCLKWIHQNKEHFSLWWSLFSLKLRYTMLASFQITVSAIMSSLLLFLCPVSTRTSLLDFGGIISTASVSRDSSISFTHLISSKLVRARWWWWWEDDLGPAGTVLRRCLLRLDLALEVAIPPLVEAPPEYSQGLLCNLSDLWRCMASAVTWMNEARFRLKLFNLSGLVELVVGEIGSMEAVVRKLDGLDKSRLEGVRLSEHGSIMSVCAGSWPS